CIAPADEGSQLLLQLVQVLAQQRFGQLGNYFPRDALDDLAAQLGDRLVLGAARLGGRRRPRGARGRRAAARPRAAGGGGGGARWSPARVGPRPVAWARRAARSASRAAARVRPAAFRADARARRAACSPPACP